MKSALLLGAGVPIRYDVFSSELLNENKKSFFLSFQVLS